MTLDALNQRIKAETEKDPARFLIITQHPTFLTVAWVAVLLIEGFAIVDGMVALYRSDEKRAKRDALLWLLTWVPALLLLLAPCS